jgi:hypothetical protein
MPLDGVLLEKENVWLWFMDFVMLPSQTLSNRQYLERRFQAPTDSYRT